MGTPRAIDVRHLGRERVICCWQVGDVLVDPGPASTVDTLLQALGDTVPEVLLLTHIHLDHAGASGALARRFPHLEICVHEVGAPHLVDPSRLLASAGRLYGDDMDRLWGETLPVPEERVRVLRGGETVHGFDVAYTPGHASHHVSYLHRESGRAFVGDVAGVRIPPHRTVLAPTPPPDIDVEAWEASLDLVSGWAPASLALTHFGGVDDVDDHLAAMRDVLRWQAELARDRDAAGFASALQERLREQAPDAEKTFVQAAPLDQLHAGLERYWRKRRES